MIIMHHHPTPLRARSLLSPPTLRSPQSPLPRSHALLHRARSPTLSLSECHLARTAAVLSHVLRRWVGKLARTLLLLAAGSPSPPRASLAATLLPLPGAVRHMALLGRGVKLPAYMRVTSWAWRANTQRWTDIFIAVAWARLNQAVYILPHTLLFCSCQLPAVLFLPTSWPTLPHAVSRSPPSHPLILDAQRRLRNCKCRCWGGNLAPLAK